MKFTIEQSSDNNEVEINIKCGQIIDEKLQKLIDQIRLYSFSIVCKKGKEIYQISLKDAYYIESVEEKTFVYLEKEVYESNLKLYELEEQLKNTFGEVVSEAGLKQLRIAETEKYAHVTFFFNGGEEKQYTGEDRILVPSPKVETYDMQPEMSAYEVTDKVCEALENDKYDVVILNFANTDMVGHTGSLPAAIKAVETVDECVGRIVKIIEEKKGNLLITADHGNAEQMIDYKTGEPHTAHTTNPVPIILVTDNKAYKLKENGKLADLAPTMLDLMGINKPEEMTGESLLIRE